MLIAHLSDPHLRPPGVLYHGVVDSNAMFEAAIAHVMRLDPRPDLVLVSGDLTDFGTGEEYALAADLLSRLAIPWLAIPGNHDSRENFRKAFGARLALPTSGPLHIVSGAHGPVRIIGLDVTIPDLHHGLVDEDGAHWLEETLAQEPDRPTILMMHQPPFASGIPYVDEYWCRGGERLAEIVGRFPAIERILCGHVHRFMTLRFGGTLLCTAPSTTTAIALRLDPAAEPASFIEPPAFLLHRWAPETGIVTHLVPIGTFPGPFTFA